MDWILENAFLIPLIPAVSFLVILLFGRSVIGVERVHKVGITAVGIVWVLSMIAAVSWITRVEDSTASKSGDTEHAQIAVNEGLSASSAGGLDGELHLAAEDDGYADDGHGYATTKPVEPKVDGWWSSGGTSFAIGTLVDGQTVLLLIVVTSISLLVHIYSSEYVKGDRRFVHYYAFLSLFTASMLFFVMAQNLVQMIVGWELVGVCSFVLIGHWWEERPNTDAAVKAFLTNRVGDIGLLVGVIILFGTFKTFDIDTINRMVGEMGSEVHFAMLIASIALMAAVCSKSGQFPLHTWLPDAMAGPTPVSALIHAATMVVAGVFMIGRLYPVFFEGFSIGTSSINLMAFIGGFTALIGAGLAFAQWDIKKVLAYSTVSQLGYMVMALGVGAWTAAMFHLFTHAFFKACLFLGAGSVSHAAHHTFDMREMGGLRKYMPHTYKTFVISTLALAGVFPFAGFWSKDEILLGAYAGQDGAGSFLFLGKYPLMLVFGCVVALLTAAYMTRVIWYTFWGEYRGHGHPHESPKVMTVPLWILAVMAVVAGAFNLPTPVLEFVGLEGLAHLVQTYAEPTHYLNAIGLSHPDPSWQLALVGLALALTGIAITFMYFWRNAGPHGLTERNRYAKAGYTFLEQKYYLDHLYTDIVVGSIKRPIARAANWFNDNVIDLVVNRAGEGARDSGRWVYRWIDQGTIDNTVNALGSGADAGGQGLRVMQTGKVQNYGSLLFGTAAVVAIVFVIVL